MRHFKEKLTVFFLIVIITIPAVYRLVRPGFYTMFDDMQVVRVWQMDKCVQDLQIPCRWVPDLGLGYGYPLFMYYAPLPYYFMETFHLFSFSFISTVKIGFISSVLLSGIFFFMFMRHLFSKKASLFATFFYVYAPIRASDIYVRGAMGEVWGMVTVPLVFWGYENLLKKADSKATFLFSLTIALFLISHNLTVLIFLPFMLVWGVIRLLGQENRRLLIINVLKSCILGFTLSAFFVLPLLFERNLVHIETLTGGYFGYLQHFLNLNQIFISTLWGYGPSVAGIRDEAFLGIGPIHTLVAVLGLIIAVVFAKKNRKKVLLAIVMAVFFFLAAFMTHEKSTLIWKSINIFEYIQFPWRFVIVSVFASSFLSAFIVEVLDKQVVRILGILLIVLTLYVYRDYFRPKDWFLINDAQKLSGEELKRQITASIYDYLPKSAKRAPDDVPKTKFVNVSGVSTLVSYSAGTNWYKLEVRSDSDNAEIALNSYSFPQWKVYVNNKQVKVLPYGDFGLISFRVSKGNNKITAYLKNSGVRIIGDYLSAASLLFVSYVYLYKTKKENS